MKIKKIEIKRFRSINDLSLELDTSHNFISICGPNNVGKTNVLRALNLFFNPKSYKFNEDAPYVKQNTRGGSIATEIFIQIEDSDAQKLYQLERKFELVTGEVQRTIKGFEIFPVVTNDNRRNKKTRKEAMSEDKTNKVLNSLIFFYIPAINVSFPELINLIINDVYELEFQKTRFSGLKGELKTSFDAYNNGLIDVLNQLAKEINPLFENFNPNWAVEFKSDAEIKKFQDLISEDISFFISDKANYNNESKGSGLQKIGFILLHQKIIEKLSNSKKDIIFCVDEPDAFLHRGLQLKLKDVFNDIAKKHQVVVTTHSPEFIDSTTLRNVILLDQEIGEGKLYQRTQEYLHTINTVSIDLTVEEGARKIQEYLGLEEDKTDLLDKYNIFVEGECDKKYLLELSKFFDIKPRRIFSLDGVSKYKASLDFYNDWYKDNPKKPIIFVLFDNDEAGRKSFQDIANKQFANIQVKCHMIPNRKGEIVSDKDKANLEIEDFIYPELVFYLASSILRRKEKLCKFTFRELERKLDNVGHANNGILTLMDSLLIDKNPNGVGALSFNTPSIKGGMAEGFKLDGNVRLVNLLTQENEKYPKVKEFIEKIMTEK